MILLNYTINVSKEDIKKTGVYTIKHLSKPEQYYVGSSSSMNNTYSIGFYNRWTKHLDDLKKNRHCNKKLQRFVNKYGLDGIRFEILEICPPEHCISMEQYWINMLDPYYNMVKIANSTLGYKHTEEYLKGCSKPVLQYSINGYFIRRWGRVSLIRKHFGSSAGVRECCAGKYGQSMGYIWRYEEDDKEVGYYTKSTCAKVAVYNLDGTFCGAFDSILAASKKLNIPVGNISKHLAGKGGKCYNKIFLRYDFLYPERIKPYKQHHKFQKRIKITDLQTNKSQIFESLREADKNGFNRGNIVSTLKKHNGIMIRKHLEIEYI